MTVTLHDSAGTQVGSVVSDGQGDFITPEGVPAGTYYARTQNGRGYVDQVYAFPGLPRRMQSHHGHRAQC